MSRASVRVPAVLLLAHLALTFQAGRCAAAEPARTKPVTVTVANFARAESDMYFKKFVATAGIGKLDHRRSTTSVDSQDVIRMNMDTFYSAGVFDLDAGPVTVVLPAPAGRFMSLLPVSEDHYTLTPVYAHGSYTFDRAQVGTRYVALLLRTFVDPNNPADVKAAHALQNQVRVEQASVGSFEVPDWDPVSHKQVRDGLLALSAMGGDLGPRFGSRAEVDPIAHLLATAAGWGGNPDAAAVYDFAFLPSNDGRTVHRLVVKDVPVDGFWSVTVYNAEGFMQKNDLGVYALNNVTAKKGKDGSYTLQFGGCGPGVANCVPIFPGWNYIARMYRPRQPILDGTWKFPKPEPVK